MMLRFHPLAQSEIDSATRWYLRRSPDAAARFRDEIEFAATRILREPDLFPAINGHYQRALLHKFPYSLVFRRDRERILIVAVAHGKRKTAYWRRREDPTPPTSGLL
jgi:plasmid stabilization system protein ParE